MACTHVHGNARKTALAARCDYSRALVTLDGTRQAASMMLAYRNHQGRASLRLAVWGAIVTPQTELGLSARMLHALRPWAMGGLPSDDNDAIETVACAMFDAIGTDNMCRLFAGRIVKASRQIETGKFDRLLDMPAQGDMAAWQAWRDLARKLSGIERKTASMVAMVLWPFESMLVPVDTHVCGRLGRDDAYAHLASKRTYNAIESMVVAEWRDAGQPCGLALWHWYKWSQRRQAVGIETPSVIPESHELLSPYYW